MIIIHAHIKVKPDCRLDFLERTKELVKQSQAEEGNISYKLYEDTEDSNTFVMVEEWKDEDAVAYHFETPHFKDFGKLSEELLQEPPHVIKYDAAPQ
ncbi:antibiotic biosynthesis monooxygenase [Salibacterium salarium]|uniref:Antibiotic biosynthesis monooxygenase n=1 Tax=Salibacterium salarium TaxID=284579 RepID=A0A3R9QM14_9BACI|nr:putative quinol monooxygenase [Salibacterium salarium]RSL33319.1 antibiotic biosynthesis monooxygenase [Salibacterium salarium]